VQILVDPGLLQQCDLLGAYQFGAGRLDLLLDRASVSRAGAIWPWISPSRDRRASASAVS
jgi:hypothetical protein